VLDTQQARQLFGVWGDEYIYGLPAEEWQLHRNAVAD
jgi:hypothetical protein